MNVRCPECYEPAQESPATDIAPCWGPPVVGASGYEPAQPEFL